MTASREQFLANLLGGYREDQVSAAFDRVKNPNHWKDPVDWIGQVSAAERMLISFAINFYTATDGTWSRVGQTSMWRVRAAGYYAGPAN